MAKDIQGLALWAAEDAFDGLAQALGDDCLVTTEYDEGLRDYAMDSFKNIGPVWTEEDIESASKVISERVWELTTVI